MKALIIHVGNKYNRAIKSIENTIPDLVYFIYNEDYEEYIDKIIKESNVTFVKRTCLINDFQSITESYEKSKKIFKELENENYEIHVGVSNGTKAMVVGLSLASVGYECEFSYVGSVEGGRENGEVKQGSEKVFEEFHPMKQLATIEINRAKKYFNNYQFDESLFYFNKARSYLDDTKKMDMYIKIVNLYQTWDKFENMISYEGKKRKSNSPLNYYLQTQIQKEINDDEDLKKYFYENESQFMEKLDKNIKFLEKKISKNGFIEDNDIYYYLPDLLNNAYRRIEEGKYDDAVARLYRAIELIAQMCLTKHNVINEKNLWGNAEFSINISDIESKNKIEVDEVLATFSDYNKSKNFGKNTFKLASKNSYELLESLGSQFATDYLNDEQLNINIGSRNRSILAHGLQPIDKDKAVELYSQVLKYAKRALPDLVEYMDMADFPKFE